MGKDKGAASNVCDGIVERESTKRVRWCVVIRCWLAAVAADLFYASILELEREQRGEISVCLARANTSPNYVVVSMCLVCTAAHSRTLPPSLPPLEVTAGRLLSVVARGCYDVDVAADASHHASVWSAGL